MIALTPAGQAMLEWVMAIIATNPVFVRLTGQEQRQLAALLACCADQASAGEAVPDGTDAVS